MILIGQKVRLVVWLVVVRVVVVIVVVIVGLSFA